MDHISVYPRLRALYGGSILPKILHHDTGRPAGRYWRCSTLVRQMYLFNGRCGSVCHSVGCGHRDPRHEVFRPVFHVLPDGASLGQSYILGRCVYSCYFLRGEHDPWVCVSLIKYLVTKNHQTRAINFNTIYKMIVITCFLCENARWLKKKETLKLIFLRNK